MIYCYKCPVCERSFDIEHPMSETSNPSEETLKKITCEGFGKCEYIEESEQEISKNIVFNRDYSSVNFTKFNSLSPEEKRKVLKNRATKDFKKNIQEKKIALQQKAVNELKNIPKKD